MTACGGDRDAVSLTPLPVAVLAKTSMAATRLGEAGLGMRIGIYSGGPVPKRDKRADGSPLFDYRAAYRWSGTAGRFMAVMLIDQKRGKAIDMETIFDWLTVITFGGLAVLYLQRSSMEQPRDKTWHYIPPAIGCAVVNYLGNHDQVYLAVGGLVLVLAYIYYVLI